MKVLVVKLSAIGDVIHALPAADILRRALSGCEITWVVEPPALELLHNNPCVDKVVVFDKKGLFGSGRDGGILDRLKGLTAFVSDLRSNRYEAAIDMQGLFKSALIGALSGAQKRFGFANTREFADSLLTHRLDVGDYFGHDRHIVENNVRLALFAVRVLGSSASETRDISIHFPLPPVDASRRERIDSLLSKFEEQAPVHSTEQMAAAAFASNTVAGARTRSECQVHGAVQPRAVLIPGTTWSTKIWPRESWVELAALLQKHLSMQVMLIGGASEKQRNNEIALAMLGGVPNGQKILDLTGDTSLLDLMALFRQIDLVVGGDTGPLHLASAVGRPLVIGIYGSTPTGRNGPYGERCHSVSLKLDCQPCFSRRCRFSTIACLNELSAKQVFQEIETLWTNQQRLAER
ncbi:MAG TPA: glycosyltransferase family 9 protein [Candidatus Obscuribacterales bacterium]